MNQVREVYDLHQVVIQVGDMEFKYDRTFWDELDHLRQFLRALHSSQDTCKLGIGTVAVGECEEGRMALVEKIEQLVVASENGVVPFNKINRKDWSNTRYDIEEGVTMDQTKKKWAKSARKKQKQILFVLRQVQELLKKNIVQTKRDLYYQNVGLFQRSQKQFDQVVDDVACLLGVTRVQIHIVASSKGLVFGHLEFRDKCYNRINCLAGASGTPIPQDITRLSQINTCAKFVLIVEKDATFQLLIDLKLHEKFPMIMVTGRGYPDLNTRAFVNMLWQALRIPILALVDADPHGLEILSVYRHGSLSLSYHSQNLVTPQIRWMGFHYKDIIDFRLAKEVLQPLSDFDRKKIADLKTRPYIKANSYWLSQLIGIEKLGYKAEIQALTEKSATFLVDTYIPLKIRRGGWI